MAAPGPGTVDLGIEVFGGKVNQYGPQALPAGASPFNQDVIFSGFDPVGVPVVGEVATRPGQAAYKTFAGNPSINYIRTYVDSLQNFRQLYLDSLGNVNQEYPLGTFSVIGTVVPGSYAQSDTLFGREWLAIGDGNFGIDIPRQWDGPNGYFDRVSQVGPGAPPNVGDSEAQYAIASSGQYGAAVSITSITETGNTVTVVPSNTSHFAQQNGESVVIAGVTPAAYNGTFIVTWDPSFAQFTYTLNTTGLAGGGGGTAQSQAAFFDFNLPAAGFVNAGVVISTYGPFWTPGTNVVVAGNSVGGYNGSWKIVATWYWETGGRFYLQLIVNTASVGLAAGAGGTFSSAGNVVAGFHQLAVMFVTREGYITRPSPATGWTAAGGQRVGVSNIPTGPPNVVQRILIFTPVITPPAVTGPFFYLDGSVPTPTQGTFASMVINDNVTTTWVGDFTDIVLEANTAASLFYNMVELGECSSMAAYSSRTFWAGERNAIPNFVNLSFQGGWGSDANSNSYPLGWQEGCPVGIAPTFYPGGNSAVLDGQTPYWNDNFIITGNGAAECGAISQSAYQDWLGVPMLSPNTSYSVRVRVQRSAGLAAGQLNINLISGTIAVTSPGIQLNYNQISTTWSEYTAVLTTPLSTIPADLYLQVYMGNTPTTGQWVQVAYIEIYPTNAPINLGQARGSYALQPEQFDGVTGIFQIQPTDGQAIRTFFQLLDNKLYVVKERSLWVTNDDGQNEPAGWTISKVADKVGTEAVRGVDTSPDGWAVIAAKDGLYIFDGSVPQRISHEIQGDWKTINWNAANKICVTVDHISRRIHVSVPTGAAVLPNAEFVMDYSQLGTASDIAEAPQAHYAYFNPTQIVAPGRARRWTTWNFSAMVSSLIIRQDGSYHLYRGNDSLNGIVYDQQTSQLSDNGVAINSQYQFAYLPTAQQEQMLQLGAHGKFWPYLTGFVTGAGSLSIFIYGQNEQRAKQLVSLPLSTTQKWDFEKNVDFETERGSYLCGTNAVGSWFHVSKWIPMVQRSISRYIRGSA